MANLFDYLAWRGDIPLSQVPLNSVDSLILSALSYVHFHDLVPASLKQSTSLARAAQSFLELPEKETEDRIRCQNDRVLLQALSRAPRFADLALTFHQDRLEPEQEMQFAALTILLPQNEAFLAFRGTDSTLVGWKEDFNMSFLDVVPAQEAALQYVSHFAASYPGPLILGGHSKGGNLAVFASVMSSPSVRDRIQAVYNNDGPGFAPKVHSAPGYPELITRIHSFVPQSSVVGMLLEHQEPYTVVKSRHIGIFQHDPYSWEVMGGDFIRLDEVSNGSLKTDRAITGWLNELSIQDRELFLDALYDALSSSDARSLDDLAQPKRIYEVLRNLVRLDDTTRSSIVQTLRLLAKSAANVWRE